MFVIISISRIKNIFDAKSLYDTDILILNTKKKIIMVQKLHRESTLGSTKCCCSLQDLFIFVNLFLEANAMVNKDIRSDEDLVITAFLTKKQSVSPH